MTQFGLKIGVVVHADSPVSAVCAMGGNGLCQGQVQAVRSGVLWMLLNHKITFCKIVNLLIAGARGHLLGYQEGSSGQALRNESVMESVVPAAGFQVNLFMSASASFSWLAFCQNKDSEYSAALASSFFCCWLLEQCLSCVKQEAYLSPCRRQVLMSCRFTSTRDSPKSLNDG